MDTNYSRAGYQTHPMFVLKGVLAEIVYKKVWVTKHHILSVPLLTGALRQASGCHSRRAMPKH